MSEVVWNFEQVGEEFYRHYRTTVGPHKIEVKLAKFRSKEGPLQYRIEMEFDVGTRLPLEHVCYLEHPHSWEEETPLLLIEERAKQEMRTLALTIQKALLRPEDYDKSTFWEKLGDDL